MRTFFNILQFASIAFAIYLSYQIFLGISLDQTKIMDLVADVGTLLICIDLTVFLWHNKRLQKQSVQAPSVLTQDVPPVVKITRKIGNFGILLIITSWIVPMING